MARTIAIALLGLLCASSAFAADVHSTTEGPVAFSPTSNTTTASAPEPSATLTPTITSGRAEYSFYDSLAVTPTAFNQIQTLGVYSAAHIAPEQAIQSYLANATGEPLLTEDYIPQATQYSQEQLYNQLDDYGVRSFHFQIYYDPTGTLYQDHAGLKIVNQSANTSAVDPKWGYPGWKIMNEPNFDFNTTCTTLVTCLFNLKNWMISVTPFVPITVFLEPSVYTYYEGTTNASFASALKSSSQNGAPNTLSAPLNITTYEPLFQPWRDLENELLEIFDENVDFTIVTPNDIMGDADNLKEAVLKDDYSLYPSLSELKNRLFFVLTDYQDNYLEWRPDLKNATMFISEPYNSEGNYTDSTLFVDFLGDLPGTNYSTNYTANNLGDAITSLGQEINKTVSEGYMVRAAADWNTWEARANSSTRAQEVLGAGAHFVQTSFPVPPTLFASSYSVALPIRGNQKQSTRCNPITSQSGIFNASVYTVGCPSLGAQSPSAAVAATG